MSLYFTNNVLSNQNIILEVYRFIFKTTLFGKNKRIRSNIWLQKKRFRTIETINQHKNRDVWMIRFCNHKQNYKKLLKITPGCLSVCALDFET